MEGALKRIKERRKEQSEQVPVPILSLQEAVTSSACFLTEPHLSPPPPRNNRGWGDRPTPELVRPDFGHTLIWFVNDLGGEKRRT